MTNTDLLAIYLQDHHAGAHGLMELLKRIQQNNSDNMFGQRAEGLAGAINHDMRVLEDVMAALDVRPSKSKDAGAWLSERLGRLKLNGHLVDYSPLSRLVGFEALTLGINGKMRLWHALQVARQSDERLGGFAFDELLDRAREQLDEAVALHEQACEIAFVEASAG
jgi:hypothetical protein